jgi:hypothetical protein
MSILDILKEYIEGIEFLAYPLCINYLKKDTDCMSLSPLQGGKRDYDIIGNFTEDYYFNLLIKLVKPTADDGINALCTLHALGVYFDEQTLNNKLPVLGEGQEAVSIRALSVPVLQSRDSKGTEVYMCNYCFKYNQEVL